MFDVYVDRALCHSSSLSRGPRDLYARGFAVVPGPDDRPAIGVNFGFHTERPLVVIRPRPGPPTCDLDLPAADRRAAAEARRVDFV